MEEGSVNGDQVRRSAVRARVLLMDDEEMVRDAMGGMLRFLGYGADCTSDGKEALVRYRQARETGTPYDVVILDLTVRGGMGGMETVGELLKIDPSARVIAASGYSNATVMEEYHRYGFRGILPKPCVMEELRRTLDEVLAGGEAA